MIQPPADSIASVLRGVFADPAYQWRDESTATLTLRRYWRAVVEWLDRLEGNHPDLFQALVWTVVLGLGAIAVHAAWVLIRTTRRPAREADGTAPVGAAVVRDAEWFAREAERLARAGRYAAAIQAEFVRLLLELDRRNVLRFHPSKTPREYLPNLRLEERPGRDFAGLVRDLYRFAFAGEPCDEAAFVAFRRQADAERYAPQS